MLWGLKQIKPLSWEEVLNIWRENEEDLEHWKIFWQERGFNSWEEWRSGTVKSLKLNERSWDLYRIKKPVKRVPRFYGGPFKNWREKYYHGEDFAQFSQIIKNTEIKNHPVINEMKNNFPRNANLIGLKTEKGIVIIEGMHRSCAVTMAADEGKNLKTSAHIALAKYPLKELVEVINRSKDKKTK